MIILKHPLSSHIGFAIRGVVTTALFLHRK
jgi:hypothetical protein